MNCIMKHCAHSEMGKKPSACDVLGECGCAHALQRAAEPGGYLVLTRNNRTISALVKAGFAFTRLVDFGQKAIVTANPKAFAFAAKQGRVEAPATESAA